MIIYELHGLNDIALDTAQRFKDKLGIRLDVNKAMELLVDVDCLTSDEAKLELRNLRITNADLFSQLQSMRSSKSWRMTAPLRTVRSLFGH